MASKNGVNARSLAEQLGYGPQDRFLIVNCDDLGSSHSANVATWRAMTQGIATSATLMVPCPWAREAAYMFRGLPIGVHLTLTSEYRSYRWRGLTTGTSLYDHDGFLPASAEAVLERLEVSDARAECRAQIKAALTWGIDVTHLDTHMNVLQRRADLYEIYLDLAEEFQLSVRMLSHAETKQPDVQARERTQARGVLFNEHLIYPWPRPTRDVFFEAIPKLPLGVSEIFAHPVCDGDELRAYDNDYANLRAQDALCLIDTALRDLLERHNIRRISFRELRDLQRKKLITYSD
jgi:predicted glycoside hydrolase/deacetylase ChbG (UPF0249 family)